jgi:anti-anti-sigma regulatory factor
MNNLTIENANFWKDHFMVLVKKNSPVEFDVAELESVDLAGVQILIGLYRECVKRKIELRMTGNLMSDIAERINKMGLSESPCASGNDVLMLIKKLADN